MEAWWHALTLPSQVFWTIGITSSLLLLFLQISAFLGFDHGGDVGHADPGISGDSTGAHMLSLRGIIAFGVGFGWGGAFVISQGFGLLAALLIGMAIGFALMLAVALMMRSVANLRYSGNLDYRNAVGKVATVYTPIPAALAGGGQVEVLVQGRLAVVSAATRGAPIPPRTRVTVVDLVDPTTLLVEAVSTETK